MKKLRVPELVDIKITDYCKFGCRYCYQGSTPAGNHADSTYLYRLLKVIEDSGVFEIAIGGGEPTSWITDTGYGNFKSILQYHYNTLFSFTTRDLQYLRKNGVIALLLDQNIAVAYSCDNAEQAISFDKEFGARGYGLKNIQVQFVIGTVSPETILITADQIDTSTLCLLGYKSINRGEIYKPILPSQYKMGNVFKHIVNKYNVNISVDTAFVRQYKEAMDRAGIDNITYYSQEGAASVYIDAVKQCMYPSSYNLEQEIPLPDPKNFLDAFSLIVPV